MPPVFDPPEFDPPVFDPPVFDPPEFEDEPVFTPPPSAAIEPVSPAPKPAPPPKPEPAPETFGTGVAPAHHAHLRGAILARESADVPRPPGSCW